MVKDILDKYEPKESLGSYIVFEKQTSRQKASLRRVRFIIWYKKFMRKTLNILKNFIRKCVTNKAKI